MSENNQKLQNEFSVKVELNEKFEKLADEVDEKVNNMVQVQRVQAEVEKGTEETLKRQGEKFEQVNVQIKEFQSKLVEGRSKTQVKKATLIQDKSGSILISPTQADHGVVNESTNENICNCKSVTDTVCGNDRMVKTCLEPVTIPFSRVT
jgi:hypothetical protein